MLRQCLGADEVAFDSGARAYRCIAATVDGPYLPTAEFGRWRESRPLTGVPAEAAVTHLSLRQPPTYLAPHESTVRHAITCLTVLMPAAPGAGEPHASHLAHPPHGPRPRRLALSGTARQIVGKQTSHNVQTVHSQPPPALLCPTADPSLRA